MKKGHGMKELTKTSRLAGAHEKLYRKLNEDFFDGELEPPLLPFRQAHGHLGITA